MENKILSADAAFVACKGRMLFFAWKDFRMSQRD